MNQHPKHALDRHTGLNYYQNSLNLIRLLAALQVLYGHLYVHLQLKPLPIIRNILSIFSGVPVFFFVSGYLIWSSIDHSKNIKEYLLKRVLRLYPELWCGVAISLISIIILYDGVVFRDIALFAITQSTFMQFWTPNSLRDFGCGTPNGALWTICIIVQFYIVAWFIKKFINKHKSIICHISILLISILISCLTPLTEKVFPTIICKLYRQTFIPYLWLFLLGAFICEHFKQIAPLLKRFWYLAAILFFVVYYLKIDINASYPVIRSILSCFFCIGFAYAFPRLQIKHDISYGIYIYHMIVINICLELGFKGNWIVGAAVLLITVLMAILSYFTVGNYSKRKKSNLSK